MPYNFIKYQNKGNNSSVKESILTKLIGYRESMVLIVFTKNESNLTNKYWDMVPDRQKVRMDGRTDGQTEWTDGRTFGRRQNYIPPTSSDDKKIHTFHLVGFSGGLYSFEQENVIFMRKLSYYGQSNLYPQPRFDFLMNIWAATWDFLPCGMCDQQRLRPACAYAQTDQSLC